MFLSQSYPPPIAKTPIKSEPCLLLSITSSSELAQDEFQKQLFSLVEYRVGLERFLTLLLTH